MRQFTPRNLFTHPKMFFITTENTPTMWCSVRCFPIFHWTDCYSNTNAKTAKETKIATLLVSLCPQQAGDFRWISGMGQQQGLHLPLALITVKIISDRRLQQGWVVPLNYLVRWEVMRIGWQDGLEGWDPCCWGLKGPWPIFNKTLKQVGGGDGRKRE